MSPVPRSSISLQHHWPRLTRGSPSRLPAHPLRLGGHGVPPHPQLLRTHRAPHGHQGHAARPGREEPTAQDLCLAPYGEYIRLGTHSQRRSNQRRAAPSCCGVAPLGLYGGCCCVTPCNRSQSGWGDANAAQYKPNGMIQQHDGAARRNSASFFSVSAPSVEGLTQDVVVVVWGGGSVESLTSTKL